VVEKDEDEKKEQKEKVDNWTLPNTWHAGTFNSEGLASSEPSIGIYGPVRYDDFKGLELKSGDTLGVQFEFDVGGKKMMRTLIREKTESGSFDVAILNENKDILSYIHIMPDGIPDRAEEFSPPLDITRWKTPSEFFLWYRERQIESLLSDGMKEAAAEDLSNVRSIRRALEESMLINEKMSASSVSKATQEFTKMFARPFVGIVPKRDKDEEWIEEEDPCDGCPDRSECITTCHSKKVYEGEIEE
jgi:hypothetical protein